MNSNRPRDDTEWKRSMQSFHDLAASRTKEIRCFQKSSARSKPNVTSSMFKHQRPGRKRLQNELPIHFIG